MEPAAGTGFALRIERAIAAPPEQVFDAFTKAETLGRWFGPSEAYSSDVLECDARSGGRWSLDMRHTGGNVHRVGGEYRAVEPPKRVVFTMAWPDRPELGHSLVTVTLSATATGTLLVLVQEQLPDAASRDAHHGGWSGSLPRLAALLESTPNPSEA